MLLEQGIHVWYPFTMTTHWESPGNPFLCNLNVWNTVLSLTFLLFDESCAFNNKKESCVLICYLKIIHSLNSQKRVSRQKVSETFVFDNDTLFSLISIFVKIDSFSIYVLKFSEWKKQTLTCYACWYLCYVCASMSDYVHFVEIVKEQGNEKQGENDRRDKLWGC